MAIPAVPDAATLNALCDRAEAEQSCPECDGPIEIEAGQSYDVEFDIWTMNASCKRYSCGWGGEIEVQG